MCISKKARNLLALLIELEDAGFITGGGSALAEVGYDQGSLEVAVEPVVTWRGREEIKGEMT